MILSEFTKARLRAVTDDSLIGTAIRNGIDKDPAATIKMIRDQIQDNKRLMAEIIGEDLVREVSETLFV